MGRKPYPPAKCAVWFCPDNRIGGLLFCARHNRQYVRSGKQSPIAGMDANLLLELVNRAFGTLDAIVKKCDQTCPFCGEHHNNHLPGCPMNEALDLLARR